MNKSKQVKPFFILATLFCSILTQAQDTGTRYFDRNGNETTKEKAAYSEQVTGSNGSYHLSAYWLNTNKLRSTFDFTDTATRIPVGLYLLYYENGVLQDSTMYVDKDIAYTFHYYPSGKLEVHYFVPENRKEPVTEAFDESGDKIKDYVFEKDAEFKGGQKAWQSYILKNVSRDLSVKSDTDVIAKVTVRFIVNKDGDVTHAEVISSSGYKNVDNDALRIIRESPEWKNAIQYNRPVNAYRVQPFTYMLQAEKKKK